MESPSNQLNVLFVNPHFTDPHVSELNALTSKVIGLNPDIVYLNTNQVCGNWILEQLKSSHIQPHARTLRQDSLKCLLLNKSRIEHIHTTSHSASSFEAYKVVVSNPITNRVSVVGLAAINEKGMLISEENGGDSILAKHELHKWFDLDKELGQVTKTNVSSVPTCTRNLVIYDNLKKLLPKPTNPKEEPKSHHGISALIHKVIDKKKSVVEEKQPENTTIAMDVNTIFCKIRMQTHAGSDHIIDEGETIHQFMFVDQVQEGGIPSLCHLTP